MTSTAMLWHSSQRTSQAWAMSCSGSCCAPEGLSHLQSLQLMVSSSSSSRASLDWIGSCSSTRCKVHPCSHCYLFAVQHQHHTAAAAAAIAAAHCCCCIIGSQVVYRVRRPAYLINSYMYIEDAQVSSVIDSLRCAWCLTWQQQQASVVQLSLMLCCCLSDSMGEDDCCW